MVSSSLKPSGAHCGDIGVADFAALFQQGTGKCNRRLRFAVCRLAFAVGDQFFPIDSRLAAQEHVGRGAITAAVKTGYRDRQLFPQLFVQHSAR